MPKSTVTLFTIAGWMELRNAGVSAKTIGYHYSLSGWYVSTMIRLAEHFGMSVLDKPYSVQLDIYLQERTHAGRRRYQPGTRSTRTSRRARKRQAQHDFSFTPGKMPQLRRTSRKPTTVLRPPMPGRLRPEASSSEEERAMSIPSPCFGVCSTTVGDLQCRGCKRTQDEITTWATLTDEQKQATWTRLLGTSDVPERIMKRAQKAGLV